MNNFDLKKFLTENKLTSNSRVNENSSVSEEDITDALSTMNDNLFDGFEWAYNIKGDIDGSVEHDWTEEYGFNYDELSPEQQQFVISQWESILDENGIDPGNDAVAMIGHGIGLAYYEYLVHNQK